MHADGQIAEMDGAAEEPRNEPPRRARIVSAAALAEREAAREAEARAADIFEEARRNGYEAGREEAAAEAIEMIARLRVDTERWTRSVENDVIDLVMRAVSKVIGEVDDLELVQRVSVAALSELRDVGRVTLHVAPKDHAAVREHLAILQQAFPSVAIADVVPDPEVGQGGAILKSPIGSIDARLSTQLEALRRALSAAFAPLDDDGEE